MRQEVPMAADLSGLWHFLFISTVKNGIITQDKTLVFFIFINYIFKCKLYP